MSLDKAMFARLRLLEAENAQLRTILGMKPGEKVPSAPHVSAREILLFLAKRVFHARRESRRVKALGEVGTLRLMEVQAVENECHNILQAAKQQFWNERI